MTTSPLVTTQWLEDNLLSVKPVDGSWYLPQMDRDALAEFHEHHIPGAVHFNIDAVADTTTGLPHMLADPDAFAHAVGAMGITESDTIVVYDGAGLFSAARVWWNFKVMGAANTFVLAGGLPKWLDENRPTNSGPVHPFAVMFTPHPLPQATLTANEVLAIARGGDGTQIVDVRSAGRFHGQHPEPRPGVRSGHIPGSYNVPFGELVTHGTLVGDEALRGTMEKAGVDLDRPIVTSCGSGVTAALLNLALAQLGIDAMQIYDGAWAEWGADDRLPVETG